MVQNPIRSDSFPLTHEVFSLMLGVRRSSVTVAAGRLSDAELIEYRRGLIRILDRTGLEKRSCECYRAIRHEYETLAVRGRETRRQDLIAFVGRNGHRRPCVVLVGGAACAANLLAGRGGAN